MEAGDDVSSTFAEVPKPSLSEGSVFKLYFLETGFLETTLIEWKCLPFPHREGMLMKHSWVDGVNCKVPCSEMVDPMASCSDAQGLNVSCVSVQFLTVASE